MRTSEERARLIHRRTAEIKQERRIKRQRRLDAACMGGEALASYQSLYLMPAIPEAAPKCISGSTSYLRV